MSHSDEEVEYTECKNIANGMQHVPENMPQGLTEGGTLSGPEDFKWRHDSVFLLCSLYQAKKEQFLSGFVKKRDLWAEVANEMGTHGFTVSHIACEKKWHNLCATFRKLKEYSRFSTKKRKSWPYYKTFQEIFSPGSGKHLSINTSNCVTMDNSCNEAPPTDPLLMPQMTDCKKSYWPVHYGHEQGNAMHPEGDSRNCEQDINSMLSVTIEENLEHIEANGNHNLPNGIPGSQQMVHDFKWTHDSVMLLCSLYIAKKDKFQSGTVKKRDLWTDIARIMNHEGYSVNCVGCEKKWHNLLATYKKVVLFNKKKTWPYLHIFQNILEEHVPQPVSLNNSDYNNMPNNHYNRNNYPDDRYCGRLGVKDDASDEQNFYHDPLNRNSIDPGDFKWTHDSVISLCTLYKERQDDFQSNMVRKRDLWNEIAGEMNIQGYSVTWAHCEKKWYNLYATYKKVTDQNRKRVRAWSTWPYLSLFQDIYDKRSIDQGMDQEQLPPPPPPPPHPTNYENETGVPQAMCSPSSNSDHISDDLQDLPEPHEHPNKKPCLEAPPLWFLQYCDRQRDVEERSNQDAERRHRELVDAISKTNQTLKDLTENLKLYINSCLSNGKFT